MSRLRLDEFTWSSTHLSCMRDFLHSPSTVIVALRVVGMTGALVHEVPGQGEGPGPRRVSDSSGRGGVKSLPE